jgi:hypothetical protein
MGHACRFEHALQHADVLAYFSHARLSPPPRQWVAACHAAGVRALASLVTEWEDGEAANALLSAALGRAAAAFAATLRSTLESLSTLEASLQWLKKSSAAEAPAAPAAPAPAPAAAAPAAPEGIAVRIGVQLTLDCHALGRELGSGALGGVLGVAWSEAERGLRAGGGAGGGEAAPLLAAYEGALAQCAPYAHLVQQQQQQQQAAAE